MESKRILFMLILCGFDLYALTRAETTVIQDENFVMYCYHNLNTGAYIVLKYTPSGSTTSRNIAQYKPDPDPNKEVNGETKTDQTSPFYQRISFSPANSFTLQNVQITDEGTYSCELRDFNLPDAAPITNELVVYARPQIEVLKMTDPLRAGNTPMNAASCSAKNGKPKAEVVWSSRNLEFNHTDTSSIGSPSSTTTSVSTLYVAPTQFYNGQTFTCTISHPTLPNGQNSSSIVLRVEYAPSTPIIKVHNRENELELECLSGGNPEPTIIWGMPSVAPAPTVNANTVRVISSQDPARQNDTYTCTAANGIEPAASASITTAEASITVTMVNQSNTGVIVGAVIGSLVILLVICALVYWFCIRKMREKDEGPYKPGTTSQTDSSSPWGRPTGRPTIEHANESLNRNRPPSPSQPPPHDEEEKQGSLSSHSDIEEDMEGHDVDLNIPLTGGDDDDMPASGIVSKNSVNFQQRRKRPSTSPHRSSQRGAYPEPTQRSMPQSDPHYEVPPMDYYDEEYQDEEVPLSNDPHPVEEMDDRFYDLPENRYPKRYQQPPQRLESLPPYTQENVQYASIDHSRKDAHQPRTRPPYLEPVEYAEIRSHGQIV